MTVKPTARPRSDKPDPPSQGWSDLLSYQSLSFTTPVRGVPKPRPGMGENVYVDYTQPGGYPDFTDIGQRDGFSERQGIRHAESRASENNPLMDRDGYTGSVPAGAAVRLPSIAVSNDWDKGARGAPGLSPMARPAKRNRRQGLTGVRSWFSGGGLS